MSNEERARVLPVMATLLLATLAFALSQTMVVPALPDIAQEYETTSGGAAWVLTGFLLSASVATPIVGKLGDVLGKGRVLTGVLLVFSVGSVVNGLAEAIGPLVAGRVLQGVAGGVFPLAFGIIRDTFPPPRVGVGIGILSAMFGIGGGIGLPLAGVIVDTAGVSLVFWSGLIAVPAALAARRFVPASPSREGSASIDWAGALALSAALAALLLALSQSNAWGWGSPATLGLLGGGLAGLVGWVRLELGRSEPLVDIRLLSTRAVAATNLTGFLVGFAMFSSFLLVPQFAQTPLQAGYGFGASATGAGLIMLPSALVMLAAGPLAGAVGSRIGFRPVLATGTAAVCASFLLLTVAHGAVWEFVVSGALLGVGISCSLAAMANLIVQAVPQRDVGIATGINTIARTMGGAFGSAVATAVVTAQVIPGTAVPAESGYTAAFLVAGAGGALALGAALAVPRPPRARMPRREPVGVGWPSGDPAPAATPAASGTPRRAS